MRERVVVGLERALELAAGLEQVADLRQRPGVAGIERRPPCGSAPAPRRWGPADVRRRPARDTGTRCRASWRSRGCRARPRRRRARPAPPRARDSDRPAGRETSAPRPAAADRAATDRRPTPLRTPPARRTPRFSASSACPRPTSADRSCRLPLERPIEVRQRRLRVLARDLEPAQGRRRRIEGRRRLQRRVELPLGVLQVAGLQEAPAEILMRRPRRVPARSAGTDRRDELGKLRRRDHRSDAPARRGRAQAATVASSTRQAQSAHLENVTAIRGG